MSAMTTMVFVFEEKRVIWLRMSIVIVSRVCASMSQGDWPESRGYPGRLHGMNGLRKGGMIKDTNSQVIYNFVLKPREPITVQRKIGFLWESRESRIRLHDQKVVDDRVQLIHADFQ